MAQIFPDGYDAIVLAGGGSRRMNGADKALIDVGGRRMLDRVLDAVAGAQTIVVVGPRRAMSSGRPAASRIVWTREAPAGSGPAAALVHALPFVAQPTVVVLAVDVPFAAAAIERLLAARHGDGRRGCDAATLVDRSGRRQPLVAAYDTRALRRRAETAGSAGWADRSMRALIEGLRVVDVEAMGEESFDCDTPEDLERARLAVSSADRSPAAAPRRSTTKLAPRD